MHDISSYLALKRGEKESLVRDASHSGSRRFDAEQIGNVCPEIPTYIGQLCSQRYLVCAESLTPEPRKLAHHVPPHT